VVSNAVRQLQHLVTDEAAVECHELFLSESKLLGSGGSCATAYNRLIPELVYQKKAEKLLADENCMKVFIVSKNESTNC
jgi:paired amphipathic helix protein Sin3a